MQLPLPGKCDSRNVLRAGQAEASCQWWGVEVVLAVWPPPRRPCQQRLCMADDASSDLHQAPPDFSCPSWVSPTNIAILGSQLGLLL
jgi:hypothetical protein